MIPSCFGSPKTPSDEIRDTQKPQNLVTSIYQTHLCNHPTLLSLTWSKTLFSHSLTIQATDSFSTTLSLSPSTFSFFRNRPGSKSISLTHHNHRFKLHCDFSKANFNQNSAEPASSFYIAIVCDTHIEFFLGDLRNDSLRRIAGANKISPSAEPALQSRREHVFGRRSFLTTAQISGSKHQIGIECNGGMLRVKVDGEVGLVVKRLAWKFRGNERIAVGGSEVEFYWDVFNWVAGSGGHGVFVFQVGDGGVWPEMVDPEKRFMRKSLSLSPSAISLSSSSSCSSVLQWAEESSDGGRSSSSCSSTRSGGSTGGFSLLLYAWKTDSN